MHRLFFHCEYTICIHSAGLTSNSSGDELNLSMNGKSGSKKLKQMNSRRFMLYARHNCIFAWSCFGILLLFLFACMESVRSDCSRNLQLRCWPTHFTISVMFRSWALRYGIDGTNVMCGYNNRLQHGIGHTVDWHILNSVNFAENSVSFWPTCLHGSRLVSRNSWKRIQFNKRTFIFATVESIKKTAKIDFSRLN